MVATASPSTFSRQLTESIDAVQHWVEKHNYRGYEPFDGLSSWFRPLTFGTLLGERLLMQAVRQSPVNLRPLLGITRKDSTKGRGYMAWGYLFLHRSRRDPAYLAKAEACLDWLDHNKVKRFPDHSWSNHFDFSSRGGSYTKDDPIIVWTSLIGLAYIEAYEQTGNARWLRIAESAANWVMKLPRERTPTGDCLSYMAHLVESIHNASMLGAALLARVSQHTGRQDMREVSRSAIEYSCSRQLPDGSWWYAEEPRYHWIDNFHTGYNLNSVYHYVESTGDDTYRQSLIKGLKFYRENFFEANGRPRYYHNRTFPVDSQCAGQAIDTLTLCAEYDPACLPLAQKVAQWTMENMQEPDGHFHYRHYPWGKAKTGMLHWSQAVIFKGMAELEEKLAAPSS